VISKIFVLLSTSSHQENNNHWRISYQRNLLRIDTRYADAISTDMDTQPSAKCIFTLKSKHSLTNCLNDST
uniref:Ovule protein n=1 Tax=Romanomermis culicivorax TaxID=13658 RepID=A0A915L770_ROMCU